MLQYCNIEAVFIFAPLPSIVNAEVVVCKMYPVDLCRETYVSVLYTIFYVLIFSLK